MKTRHRGHNILKRKGSHTHRPTIKCGRPIFIRIHRICDLVDGFTHGVFTLTHDAVAQAHNHPLWNTRIRQDEDLNVVNWIRVLLERSHATYSLSESPPRNVQHAQKKAHNTGRACMRMRRVGQAFNGLHRNGCVGGQEPVQEIRARVPDPHGS